MEPYSPLRPDEMFVLATISGCGDWIVAVMLLLVGLISVRKALPKAGYLVGGGGLLLFLSQCCTFAPNLLGQMGLYFEGGQMISSMGAAIGLLTHLGGWAAIMAGAVLLAQSAISPPGPASTEGP